MGNGTSDSGYSEVKEAPLPSPTPTAGIQIGQLLIEQGVLTQTQVAHILKVQKMSHRPFGDLAERLYGINPRAVEDAWVEQYLRMVGTVDLDDVQVDTECLRLLNRRQAWQFHLLPIGRKAELEMATTAEHLVRSVNFSSRSIDEPVHFLIAERQQLREFLMKHYPVPEYLAQYASEM
jgi:type II secretion system (T2SS) protein E